LKTASEGIVTETENRRASILRASAELFARQGVASTTVRQIAAEVGVLSGSLFHHFPSKDAIVAEIVTGHLQELRERYRAVLASDRAPRAQLEALISTSLRLAESSPDATVIYQNEIGQLRELPQYAVLKEDAAEVQQAWLTVLEAGRADGSFRTEIDPKVLYRFLRDAMWLSMRWWRTDGSYTVDQLATDCASIFLDGYAAFDPD
jgi:TetR/AcrR family transcriptional regulator, cholesterol catabolism regulator